jgi:DNA-binding HxlR family transcriptional regulator
MEMNKQQLGSIECGKEGLLAIKDTMVLLSGKWKIQIIGCLMMHGTMRFMDMRRSVEGIAAKMLSKELQELEQNKLIRRNVMNTRPVTVEYELTEHGASLLNVISEIRMWGVAHRQYLFHKR